MEENQNQPEPSMSENNDENQKENPEPWKDLPAMEKFPAPFEQFRADVGPVAWDLDFWEFCQATDSPDPFLATSGEDLRALQDYDRVALSDSFLSSLHRNLVETGEDPFVIKDPATDRINRVLYRFLDGGFALVGRSDPEDAHFEIVSLLDLTGHKLYLSANMARKEKRINEMWDKVERFGQFAKNQAEAVRANKERAQNEEEPEPEKIERVVLGLYRSEQAASIHRASVYFRCWKEGKIKDDPDPEETPE